MGRFARSGRQGAGNNELTVIAGEPVEDVHCRWCDVERRRAIDSTACLVLLT
jgi:hypothetical protein